MGVVKKMTYGKLIFEEDENIMKEKECDLMKLFETGREDRMPQMIVRTVTHLNSENACSAECPGSKQIAVNEK